ncbi:hypothetical protein [Thermobrachium celere]|uniref:hypothetical protein n=1 Tax=Thermobrachium celere TaxID=53422 RepID=UPI00194325F7|nr:hypothetical protein [Thermobrachium celere]GFR34579.1 hypothetical protein TCEA9_03910 [Thermobrachium celere]
MIIDLSFPRKAFSDIFNQLMFNLKLKYGDFEISDAALEGMFLTSFIIANNSYDIGSNSIEEILYPIIFATCEIINNTDYETLSRFKRSIYK